MASLISRLLEPLTLIFFLFGLALWQSGVTGMALVRALGLVFFVGIVPPACLLFFAVQRKWVTNWDLSNRTQRVKALGVFLFFLVIDLYVGWKFPYPFFHQMLLYFIVLFLGFFLLTLRWKISGHMTMLTTTVLFIVNFFGWQWAPLVLLIPLLGWSRLVLKRHTLGQIIGGVVYASTIFIVYSQFLSVI